jgi:amino acid adenylation domain-containing protein/thioester reductase-like protein
VTALLAVLKAGGAYLPLDPELPPARLAAMLGDARPAVLITEERLAAAPGALDVRVLCLDRDREEIGTRSRSACPAAPPSCRERTAYLMHTSGSSGRPKAIPISHRAAAGYAQTAAANFGLRPGDRVLQFASAGSDISVEEIFPTLACGATLVIATPEMRLSAARFLDRCAAWEVSVCSLPTAFWHELVPEVAARPAALHPALRLVCLGGEEPRPEKVAAWLAAAGPRVVLLNSYGPTETTVVATLCRLAGGPGRVPLGRPVANVRTHVLDAASGLVPLGVAGELCIGGAGLSRGYLDQPAETAVRFTPDPIAAAPGDRLYRSGDGARRLPDGRLEYLGRLDDQVKVRGFRVEPGEIESLLLAHPAVAQAAVLLLSPEQRAAELVAYVVPAGGDGPGDTTAPDPADLRRHLAERLPEPLVPRRFVALDRLPLLPNGKIDRPALRDAAPVESAAAAVPEIAPWSPVEQQVAAIWSALLGSGRIGPGDDFFALGGHSLLAIRMLAQLRQAFGVELDLREAFVEPTVAGLAHRIEAALGAGMNAADGAGASLGSPLPRVPRQGNLPLSSSQLRQWFLVQLEPATTAYNLPLVLRLRGALRREPLARSLDEIVARHETLRTTFNAAGGQPAAAVAAALRLPLPLLDLSRLPAADRRAEARRVGEAAAARVFDLERGPLLETCLVRLEPAEHLLLLDVHHIVFDGWSWGVFTRELAMLYAAFRDGRPSPLPPLAIQYVDYAAWQQQWLTGEQARRQVDYWRSQLAGAAEALRLPTDYPRPAVQSHRGASQQVELPLALGHRLRALALAERVTPFMALLAAWSALLQRYTGQDDVNVGTFVANRGRPEIEPLLGFFVNTLVLRTNLAGEPSWLELLTRVREMTLGAYEHQALPFEVLLAERPAARDLSRTPLFQVMLGVQNYDARPVQVAGLELAPEDPYALARANADLALWIYEEGDAFHGTLHYATDLFAPVTVKRLLGHLAGLLAAALAAPRRRLQELPLLAPAERHQAIVEWSGGEAGAGRGAGEPLLPVHRRIRDQALRRPEQAAVVAGDAVVTYGELARRAAALRDRLRALGAGPETVVGLCCPRGPEMIVGLLGILEAGATYLPLDPDLPAARLRFLTEDAGVAAVFAPLGLPASLADFPGPVLGAAGGGGSPASPAPPDAAAGRHQRAYILYTSGSTGRPKGVQVDHAALALFTRAACAAYGLAPGDRVLQFAAASFDASVEEIFPCLTAGATLVLRDDAMLASPSQFLAACRDWEITVLDLPTAYWHTLAPDLVAAGTACPPGLRLVILGGEQALPEPVRGWLTAVGPRPLLVNTYGPTEATVVATGCRLRPSLVTSSSVPIGRPWGEARIWLLDPWGNPVPVGVEGELHIGGGGLARGYVGRPDLTAQRFLPCPFAGCGPGARIYRTGDLARQRRDGSLEFAGRADDQVKIRGFRVEPAEIAAVLAAHPAVREAAVVARETAPGSWRLIAYVVNAGEAAPGARELRDFLAARLPAYMVPADYLALAGLPRTATGKLDRGALPTDLTALRGDHRPAPAAAENPTEALLVSIWRDLLDRQEIGIDDNLFELGAHSLLAPRFAGRVLEVFRLKLPLQALFTAPTVRQLAAAIADSLLRQIEELGEEEEAALAAGGELASPPPPDLRAADALAALAAMTADSVLDPAIAPESPAGRSVPAMPGRPGGPATVLLTGATGFLGAHLLAELLRQTDATVVCLVRAPGVAAGAERLRRGLAEHGRWDAAAASRIEVLPGDLSRPLLGLSRETFDALGARLDAIYHNGAWVNGLQPYQALRTANVQGTREVLRLAFRARTKPVHFVSTLDVFFSPEYARLGVYLEDDGLEHGQGPATGYARSKWVADKLVAAARRRGLPASTYRLGRVSWHSRSGDWSASDPLRLVFDTCLRVGCAPDLDVALFLSPVDFLAEALVAISLRPESSGRCFHLVNPREITLRDLVEWARALGMPLATVPYRSWLEAAKRGVPTAALPHLEGLPTTADGGIATGGGRDARLDRRNALAALAGAGIACPDLDQASLRVFLERRDVLPGAAADLVHSLQGAGDGDAVALES